MSAVGDFNVSPNGGDVGGKAERVKTGYGGESGEVS